MITAILVAAAIGAAGGAPEAPEVPDTLIDAFRTASFPLNGWTFLISSDSAIVLYRFPVTRQGGLPRITTRTEFAKPQGPLVGRYLSLRQVVEMDCIRGLSHRLEHAAYKARNLDGPPVDETKADEPWVAPDAGSLDEAVFRKACAPLQ